MAYTRFRGKRYIKTDWGRLPPSEAYIMGGYSGLECMCCRLLPKVEVSTEFLDKHDEVRRKFNEKHNANLPMTTRPHFIFDTFITNSRRDMLRHMQRHRKAGHAIPKAAYKRLWREYKTIGDEC